MRVEADGGQRHRHGRFRIIRCVLSVATLSAVGLVLISSPAVAVPSSSPTFVQGNAVTTSSRVASVTVGLAGAVAPGDLLVGWFAQYNAPGQVQVSDNVNGAWTRAPGALAFGGGTGDIALYYVANAKAAAGLTVTVAASAAAYYQAAVAEYSGVAVAGPLDQIASHSAVSAAVDTGATASVGAGELVYSALVTGGNPSSVTAGNSQGVGFTPRSQTSSGSVFEQDVVSSAAGAQDGRATLGTSTDWYAVAAVFHPASAGDTVPPTTPAGLHATSVASSSVSLSWSASTDNVAVTGYTVYRNGVALATTGPTTTSYNDQTVVRGTTYTYTVDAFDAAGNHSVPSAGLPVAVPSSSPTFVQATSGTTSTAITSTTLALSAPVVQGDLLVGWFAQYNAPGQVQVSDNINGAWTRAPGALAFQGGTGDIALYYVPNAKAAPGGLTVTVAAGAATYFQSAVAEYSGMAVAGPLDQLATRTAIGTGVDTGATAPVGAGELVYSALVTGGSPGSVTLGSSHGVGLTLRSQTSSGSVSEQDILATAAGAQDATATLGVSTDWYAVTAVFLPTSVGDTVPPTTPAGLHTTSVASTSVSLAWSASTDNVGVRGYTVYRNGAVLTVTGPTTTSFNDQTVTPGGSYTYTVDAFDSAGNHSAPSAGLPVSLPKSSPAFVQATSGTTSAKVASTTLALSAPVAQGDLLVGWFAQYNAAGHVQVSDNINGAWARAPAAVAFQNDTGDIALYYVANAKAAPGGVTVTSTASAPAYFESTAAEYSGIAIAGPLDSIASARDVSTAVYTGATAPLGPGELVYSALVTGGNPGSVTPGSSQGVKLTPRSQTSSGSVFEQDALSSATGTQDATSRLSSSTDWYAVTAVFLPTSVGDTVPPTTPPGLHGTSVASTNVSLAWSASTDNVGVRGYTVYRNGIVVGTVDSATIWFNDQTVAAGASYTYTVDAFDGAGNHSAPTSGLQVSVPSKSPSFVQGASDSPGTRLPSTTLTLSAPVVKGDLLVGWFAQYDATGQVQVSDNVNGAWTRGPVSERFRNGGGDLALYYVQNTNAAPGGLTVTISAAKPTYLPGALAEFSGVATANALDQGSVGSGTGMLPDSGSTAAAPAGELVFGALITAGQPLTVTPGFSQGAPFLFEVHNGSESADGEAILSSAAGGQDARFSIVRSGDWYATVATFRAG